MEFFSSCFTQGLAKDVSPHLFCIAKSQPFQFI